MTITDATIDSITARIIAQHAPVVVHEFKSRKTVDRIYGWCACLGLDIESMGTDESSRLAVKSAYEAHVRRETA